MRSAGALVVCGLLSALFGAPAWAEQATDATPVVLGDVATETDFLADVPTVMSVSRIAQSLEDTPGAVTILDRDFIHMSGARDVVSLLAYVPGFQTTTSYETDVPMATYHGRVDDWANRIQVLVDGRSVYSGLLQGSAGMGWQSLQLDDIERIEILRGSNSATYGARAFLGVVNIISRDVRDTVGQSASVTNGENGIVDQSARYGWKSDNATSRLSIDSSRDNGLQNAFGQNYTERMNFSSHLVANASNDVDLRAGAVGVYAGHGTVGDYQGNPARERFIGTQFLQADWHYVRNDANDIAVSYSHTENTVKDRFLYATNDPSDPYYLATVDFSGNEYVDRLSLQQSTRQSASIRTVLGMELSQERDVSPSSFDGFDEVTSNFYRAFGSAEWRLSDSVLLNGGALAEHSDLGGDSVSPRLMLNWHFLPGHTFRFGGSTAFRPPSSYEKYAQVRYYDTQGQNPTPYYVYNNGTLKPERLESAELGYYYGPADARINADVRVFNEKIIDGIAHTDTNASITETYVNSQNFDINGAEWQMNWFPSPATRVFFSQTWTTVLVDASLPDETLFRTEHSAPSYAASLVLSHTFDNGLQLSLLHQAADNFALDSISQNQWLSSAVRDDVRIAKSFRMGPNKAEWAFVVQNLDAPYQDGDWKFRFTQKAMVTLKIEN